MMTFVELELIYEKVRAYGFKSPMLDIGGVLDTGIRLYSPLILYTPKSGSIWSGLSNECDVTHDVQAHHGKQYGTIVSTSTLEHVHDLFGFFGAVGRLLTADGICVLSAPFKFPRHGDYCNDLWRFTPNGLEVLVKRASLKVIDSGIVEADKDHRAFSWIVCGNEIRAPQAVEKLDLVSMLNVVPE